MERANSAIRRYSKHHGRPDKRQHESDSDSGSDSDTECKGLDRVRMIFLSFSHISKTHSILKSIAGKRSPKARTHKPHAARVIMLVIDTIINLIFEGLRVVHGSTEDKYER